MYTIKTVSQSPSLPVLLPGLPPYHNHYGGSLQAFSRMPLRDALLLLLAGLTAIFLAPVHMEEVTDCQDVGWKENSATSIDNCNIFDDDLTVDLTKIVSKPECFTKLEVGLGWTIQY